MRRILPFVLMFLAAPALAAPVTIGESLFELGEAAFPTGSVCLTASCSGDVPLFDAAWNPVSREQALLGHELSLVVIDMDAADEFRLTFPEPIVNQPGVDLYLAQAAFIGDIDLADGIHDMQIRFEGSATWHTLASNDFTEDLSTGALIVNIADPEPKQVAYSLYYTKQDLSTFGLAPGAAITGFDLRGLAGGTGGLDTVVVGNLNIPEPGTGASVGGAVVILTVLARRRRRSKT